MHLTSALAYRVFDSRGYPTIAVRLACGNKYAVGMSPSGASTGSHEAFELRDGTAAFSGKDVETAIAKFNNLVAPVICQREIEGQQSFDSLLVAIDGTANFQTIGGNTAIAASIAFLRLLSSQTNLEVYECLAREWQYKIPRSQVITPLVNVINGGKHASSGLAIQEVMIVPLAGNTTTEKIMIAGEVFNALRSQLKGKRLSTLVGDEGGFAPGIHYLEEAITLIAQSVASAGLKFGDDIAIALDCAATELYKDQQYALEGRLFSVPELVDFYIKAIANFHIVSLEDPFAEDDFAAWTSLQQVVLNSCQIVGDDLTVTNVARMKEVEVAHLVSAVIIKPNQIGTISQTMAAVKLAQAYNWKPIISHRSGETEDTTIADIAVAVQAPFIKTGSMSRSERMAKYNRLLQLDLNQK